MRVTIADGVLKMCKGSLDMMKATRRRNMYFLQGGVVLGRAAPMFDAKGKGKADTASNRHLVRKKSVKIWVKKGSFEEDVKNQFGFGEQSVLGKMRVKFATPVHQIFDVVESSHMIGDSSSGKDMQHPEIVTPAVCPDEADDENHSVVCEDPPQESLVQQESVAIGQSLICS